jgi:hypothetical protein
MSGIRRDEVVGLDDIEMLQSSSASIDLELKGHFSTPSYSSGSTTPTYVDHDSSKSVSNFAGINLMEKLDSRAGTGHIQSADSEAGTDSHLDFDMVDQQQGEKPTDTSTIASSTGEEYEKKMPEEEAAPKPVGIMEFARYATKTNTTLNIIGILAAVVAGAAQPLMTIVSDPFLTLQGSYLIFGLPRRSLEVSATIF